MISHSVTRTTSVLLPAMCRAPTTIPVGPTDLSRAVTVCNCEVGKQALPCCSICCCHLIFQLTIWWDTLSGDVRSSSYRFTSLARWLFTSGRVTNTEGTRQSPRRATRWRGLNLVSSSTSRWSTNGTEMQRRCEGHLLVGPSFLWCCLVYIRGMDGTAST